MSSPFVLLLSLVPLKFWGLRQEVTRVITIFHKHDRQYKIPRIR